MTNSKKFAHGIRFYGIVPVIPKDESNGCMCFYFDFNTAFMLPHVNGLLVAAKGGLRLYVNEFAVTADQFRSSKLVHQMNGAVFDPVYIVANDCHIAFYGKISRNDETMVLDALEQQTGIRYRTARMNRHSF